MQTGVRLEKRMLKVLKALAEYHDITLGDLFEGMFLHALDGKTPFSKQTLKVVGDLRNIYDFDLRAEDSHKLDERVPGPKKTRR